jgi:hypothetical protein
MGKLSGYSYREIVKRLKFLDSPSNVRRQAVTKFGIMKKIDVSLLFQTTQGICRRELSGQY